MGQNGVISIENDRLPKIEKKNLKQDKIIKNDSEIEGCIWYRLVLDANFPEGAHVKVSYLITDEDTQDIRKQDVAWSKPISDPRDTLIFGPRGRYLWLKLKFSVDNPKAELPTIKKIKLHFSAATYLKYLPAIYQEDPTSRDFLERYLSVFETLLANLESHIDAVPLLFDVEATRSNFLPWLSTWLGTIKDENWPEEKWRVFLSRAVELYKRRGTKWELEELIKMFSGAPTIAIIEPALLNYDNQYLKKVLKRLIGGKYSFCILLKPEQVKTGVDRKVIKRLIDSEKPAHTRGGFAVIENSLRLDWHTYLGVNTCLRMPKGEMIVGKAVLPLNTVLTSDDKNLK